MLLFVFMGVAGVAGALLGSRIAERYIARQADNPDLTPVRKGIVTAVAVVVSALAIFAVLSGVTLVVMRFM